MRYFLKRLVPVILVIVVLISIGWYFLMYDTSLTRDLLLQQAHQLEHKGNTTAAVWLYHLAYLQSGKDDMVAIELSEQYKKIGNYTKAESTLIKSIQDGGSVSVYIALCKTYIEQNKLRDAVAMLDKVADPQVKAQLDAMRPDAPSASEESGTYSQNLRIEITSKEALLYVSTDRDYPSPLQDVYSGPLALGSGDHMVYAVCIGENGLISPLSTFHYIVRDVVQEVFFTDGYIEAAIRQQLLIPDTHPVYSSDLWTVENFQLPALAQSCEDLKWMTNLKELTIADSSCIDFAPISQLKHLAKLTISDTPMTDGNLDFLSSLAELQNLTLTGCGISSISVLSQLTSLQYLNLTNNAIRNLAPLAELKALESLSISNNALTTLQDIVGLQRLHTLDVSYNALVTTDPVKQLPNLVHLDVSSNNLMKLEGIDQLYNLETFAAAYNNLIDVDLLAGCIKLRYLDVSHNTLLNIQALGQLSALEEFDFSHNEVSKLPTFRADSALRIIHGEHNIISSLDPLSDLQNLTHIYMDYNSQISSINALKNCPALKEVNVYGTNVTNVKVLADKGIMVHYTPKT